MSRAFVVPNADNWFSLISRWKAGQGLHGHKTREAHLDSAREVKISKCLFILSWNKVKTFCPNGGERIGELACFELYRRRLTWRSWEWCNPSATCKCCWTGKSLATWEDKAAWPGDGSWMAKVNVWHLWRSGGSPEAHFPWQGTHDLSSSGGKLDKRALGRDLDRSAVTQDWKTLVAFGITLFSLIFKKDLFLFLFEKETDFYWYTV